MSSGIAEQVSHWQVLTLVYAHILAQDCRDDSKSFPHPSTGYLCAATAKKKKSKSPTSNRKGENTTLTRTHASHWWGKIARAASNVRRVQKHF